MSGPTTTATTTGQVRGQQVPGGIRFAGIPFAQPPVGPLRLRPPQPPAAWAGVRAAEEVPPAPAQSGTALGGGGKIPWANDEDCLYLNVATPALDRARPVIVWIYGGGFEVGTASPPMTDVAAFGGGAAGTFHRAILSSGSTERIFSAATGTTIAEDLLAALGLTSVNELGDVPVERLLATQGAVIESDVGRRNLPGGSTWGIVLDGSVLPRHPTTAVQAGAAAHLPQLVSSNRDEMKAFQGLPGFAPADSDAVLADIRQAGIGQPAEQLAAYRARHPHADLTQLRSRFLGDAIYIVPADRLAKAQIAAGGAAYRAVFAADPFGPPARGAIPGRGHQLCVP